MRTSRKTLAALLPLVIASAVLTVTPSAAAAPAGALACSGQKWSDKDKSGAGTTKDRTGGAIRTGPHSNCDSVIWPGIHDELDYHCYTRNSAGQTWTHVRPLIPNGSSRQGWVWDEHLDDGGSKKPC